MKKIILFLVCVICLFASCNCSHSWKKDGTMVYKKDTVGIEYCKMCHQTRIVKSDSTFLYGE